MLLTSAVICNRYNLHISCMEKCTCHSRKCSTQVGKSHQMTQLQPAVTSLQLLTLTTLCGPLSVLMRSA